MCTACRASAPCKDFGVVYPGKPDDLVQDDVALQISFVAPRSPAPVVQ